MSVPKDHLMIKRLETQEIFSSSHHICNATFNKSTINQTNPVESMFQSFNENRFNSKEFKFRFKLTSPVLDFSLCVETKYK